MLELFQKVKNIWNPPYIGEQEAKKICKMSESYLQAERFVIFKVEPYIDAYYIQYGCEEDLSDSYMKRFTFHEDYRWSYEDELVFEEMCVKNERILFDGGTINCVYKYFSEEYPDWKLQRYHTKSMRLLEHIYHCMRKGSAKEILYKAGLDELAANVDMLDEIDLMSRKPSDIYEGITIRNLRALNCKEGALLLSTESNRKYIKELQIKFPSIFNDELNEAQCKYLRYLIDGDLTIRETGRLFEARMAQLKYMWTPAQYDLFIWMEKKNKAVEEMEDIAVIDSIYSNYIKKVNTECSDTVRRNLQALRFYLINQREEYNRLFRRSNRKRDIDWQERNNGYVVRYPQTINDFCRESIYMSNCLLTYVDAYIQNDTTVLFMRKTDEFNTPFITLEIFNNTLMQAYHRFNRDCSVDEAKWIWDYCGRHGISRGEFKFDRAVDELG